ncbi:uncharacterized protein LOC133537143 [Nerophis ophidion]|uniref:uncharacterized protein LOC133537143 n=1 Tax=Nerophis ophidion TaxID=159077 RepID=UPI002ADF2E6E|nr:uncharacterized protein LOC133537143 [Nerophis ophidion]
MHRHAFTPVTWHPSAGPPACCSDMWTQHTSNSVRWNTLHVYIAWQIHYKEQLKHNIAKYDRLHGDTTSQVPAPGPPVSLTSPLAASSSAFGLLAETRPRRCQVLGHDLSWREDGEKQEERWKRQQESADCIQMKKTRQRVFSQIMTAPHTGARWYCHRNRFKHPNRSDQFLLLGDRVNCNVIKCSHSVVGRFSEPQRICPAIVRQQGPAHLSRATPTGDEKHLHQLCYSPFLGNSRHPRFLL